MIFEASRAKALNQLNNFVNNNLSEYSKLRNFDFGPEKRSNISCLSKPLTTCHVPRESKKGKKITTKMLIPLPGLKFFKNNSLPLIISHLYTSDP